MGTDDGGTDVALFTGNSVRMTICLCTRRGDFVRRFPARVVRTPRSDGQPSWPSQLANQLASQWSS